MSAVLMAALLAYVPAPGSLIKQAAARTIPKAREITMTGTVTVKDQGAHGASLTLHFPLSCKLEGDGVSLLVKGTAARPAGTAEGTTGPALQLLQLACPLLAYRGMPAAESEEALRNAAQAAGADVTTGGALARLGDRVVYVLGAGARDLTRPQLWIYKDTHAPARLIAQGGADLRLLEYGNPASADAFPRVIELWEGGQLTARFEVLETRGARGAGAEEEDDSQ
jgi:hypothetical protein